MIKTQNTSEGQPQDKSKSWGEYRLDQVSDALDYLFKFWKVAAAVLFAGAGLVGLVLSHFASNASVRELNCRWANQMLIEVQKASLTAFSLEKQKYFEQEKQLLEVQTLMVATERDNPAAKINLRAMTQGVRDLVTGVRERQLVLDEQIESARRAQEQLTNALNQFPAENRCPSDSQLSH